MERSSVSDATPKTPIKWLAGDDLCRLALNQQRTAWREGNNDHYSDGQETNSYVREALDRGYKVRQCLKLIRANAAHTPSSTNPIRKEIYKESPSGENRGAASITQRLETLKKLEDAGLISKEEAAAKRKEILKNL